MNTLPIGLNSARGLCFFSSNCGRKGAVETSAIGCLVQFNLVGSRLLGCPFLYNRTPSGVKNMLHGIPKYLITIAGAITIAQLFIDVNELLVVFSWGFIAGAIIIYYTYDENK